MSVDRVTHSWFSRSGPALCRVSRSPRIVVKDGLRRVFTNHRPLPNGSVKCLIALLCIGLFGCANPPLPLTYARPADLRTELRADADTLRTLRPSLDELDREFAALRESGDWRNRGYFSVEETNQIAALLFRFVTAHSALWKITAAYQKPADTLR